MWPLGAGAFRPKQSAPQAGEAGSTVARAAGSEGVCRSPTHTLLLAPRGRMRQPFLGTPVRPLEPAPGGGKREETQREACEGKGTPGGADSKASRRSGAGNLQGDRGPVGLPAGRCHPLQKFQELKVCGRSVLRPFCHWSLW